MTQKKTLSALALSLLVLAPTLPALAQTPTDTLSSTPSAPTATADEAQDDANAATSSHNSSSAASTQAPESAHGSSHNPVSTQPSAQASAQSAPSSAPSQPRVSLDQRGLRIRSANDEFSFGVKGYAQPYFFGFAGESADTTSNGFGIRTFRLTFDAQASKYVSFRYTLDVQHGTTRTFDAFATIRPHEAISLRFGQQRSVFGLERAQSPTAIAFLDRSLVSEITPNRDIGVVVDVTPYKGIQVELGAFNGVDDGAVYAALQDETIEFQGRINLAPLQLASVDTDTKIGIGAAVNAGRVRGSETDTRLAGYRTSGRNRFINYAPGAYADGLRVRTTAYGYVESGSLFVLGEYVQNHTAVQTATEEADLTVSAWNLTASWALGGKNTFNGVVPANNLGSNGGLGALQIKARVHGLNVDDSVDGALLPSATATSQALAASAGLSWWFNPNVRVSADYNWTSFSDRDGETSADAEHNIALSLTFGL